MLFELQLERPILTVRVDLHSLHFTRRRCSDAVGFHNDVADVEVLGRRHRTDRLILQRTDQRDEIAMLILQLLVESNRNELLEVCVDLVVIRAGGSTGGQTKRIAERPADITGRVELIILHELDIADRRASDRQVIAPRMCLRRGCRLVGGRESQCDDGSTAKRERVHLINHRSNLWRNDARHLDRDEFDFALAGNSRSELINDRDRCGR